MNIEKAQRPINIRKFANLLIGFCPVCGDGSNSEFNFCPVCGQKLDWSEDDKTEKE